MPPEIVRPATLPRDLLPGVRHIVLLRPNAVGDFIFALPCLHALRAAYPQARITYLGKPWHATFLRERPGPIDEVSIVPPCPGITLPADATGDEEALEAWVTSLRETEIDLAIQAYGGGRYSNPLLRRLQARCTIGLRSPDAEPLDRWLHYGPLQNRRLQLLELASLAGAHGIAFHPELQVTPQDHQAAQAVLPRRPGERLVLIQPAVSDNRRCWAAAHFAAVADALAREGATIAINGTAQEADKVRAVAAQMRAPAIDLTDKLSLSALCGLLARADLLVSNDTGPLHLALAVGTPAVGIYWLTNLIESGPLRQEGHRPLLATRTHCPVCGQDNLGARCEHDASFVDEVTVDAVLSEALSLWRARK